jgi:hypothetical protein
VVLRWAELASVTLEIRSGYEGPYLASCALRDQAGATISVTNNWRNCDDIARLAQDQLGARLAPELIRRYEAGEPVTFGHLTIDQPGLSSASGLPWRMPWHEMREVNFTMHGHRVSIRRTTTRAHWETALKGAPNDFLARYVITHAARRAGAAVTGA